MKEFVPELCGLLYDLSSDDADLRKILKRVLEVLIEVGESV